MSPCITGIGTKLPQNIILFYCVVSMTLDSKSPQAPQHDSVWESCMHHTVECMYIYADHLYFVGENTTSGS